MVGEEVTIAGFAESVRGRGGICFVTLRDGTGKIQAFLKRGSLDDESFEAVQSSPRESTIMFRGNVARKRPPKTPEGAPPPPKEIRSDRLSSRTPCDCANAPASRSGGRCQRRFRH